MPSLVGSEMCIRDSPLGLEGLVYTSPGADETEREIII